MIRDYENGDRHALESIHAASGFDYKFPDLDDPLFIVKKVIAEDLTERVIQGIALKLQAEVYIWVEPDYATPEVRWQRLQELTDAAKLAAWEKGLDSLVCVVPPEIADSFEKRLKQIGMSRDRPWPKFSFDLREYVPRVESEIAQGENHNQPSLQP
jgi:hypothetical protein